MESYRMLDRYIKYVTLYSIYIYNVEVFFSVIYNFLNSILFSIIPIYLPFFFKQQWIHPHERTNRIYALKE